jgi:hypothetical protein
MPVYYAACGSQAKCSCEVALAFSGDPDHAAIVGKCSSSSMCKNTNVINIFNEQSCYENVLTSIDQAFNQSFWNDPRRQKARISEWLDCASLLGKKDYFVCFFLNKIFSHFSK